MEVLRGYEPIFGALTGGLLIALLLIRPVLGIRGRGMTVQNYASREVPVLGGVFLALALVAGYALFNIYRHFLDPPTQIPAAHLYLRHAAGPLLAALGFFSLGLIDDLSGHGATKGFRGHARALARGELTTGGVKALGGGLVSIIAAGLIGSSSGWSLLLHALVIVLAANLLNLLDLRPGRATKAYLIGWVAVALAGLDQIVSGPGFASRLSVTAFVSGCLVVWMYADLGEKAMLGDSGSNLLGALLGVSIVVVFGRTGELIAAAILMILNLASEIWSFSNFIDRVAPLRWLDRLGQKREETSGSTA